MIVNRSFTGLNHPGPSSTVRRAAAGTPDPGCDPEDAARPGSGPRPVLVLAEAGGQSVARTCSAMVPWSVVCPAVIVKVLETGPNHQGPSTAGPLSRSAPPTNEDAE